MIKLSRIVFIFLIIFFSGCGTFIRHSGLDVFASCNALGSYIYGGTYTDVKIIQSGFTYGKPTDVVLGIVDIPFSMVADTMMLPIAIPKEIERKKHCVYTKPLPTRDGK